MSSELLPIIVKVHGKTYNVLPLSPGLNALRTNADLILPPPAAFANMKGSSSPQYPRFTSTGCNWTAVFAAIRQPLNLWDCWGPGNLGDYSSVDSLWDAWDTGRIVVGVGQKPPLRLVEEEWGEKKKTDTQKGRQQMWRIKGNTLVGRHLLRSSCSVFSRS